MPRPLIQKDFCLGSVTAFKLDVKDAELIQPGEKSITPIQYVEKSMKVKHRVSGFTLLEVLLALLIISVALVALVETTGYAVKQTAELDQRQQAYQVADQVLMKLYQQPNIGNEQGSQQRKDQTYYWSVEVQNTDNPRILRLDVKVGIDRQMDYAMAQLTGFKKQ